MAIIASAGPSYAPAPAGAHPALCVDVHDMGILEVSYQGKTKKQHKIRVTWKIGETRDDGKAFLLHKRYTLSLHEKSGLRKDLESWRGRPFTDEELKGFDVEKVIGVPALLNVIHAANNGSTYANVSAIMPLPKSMASLAPLVGDYVRAKDRPPEGMAVGEPPAGFDEISIDDNDVPF